MYVEIAPFKNQNADWFLSDVCLEIARGAHVGYRDVDNLKTLAKYTFLVDRDDDITSRTKQRSTSWNEPFDLSWVRLCTCVRCRVGCVHCPNTPWCKWSKENKNDDVCACVNVKFKIGEKTGRLTCLYFTFTLLESPRDVTKYSPKTGTIPPNFYIYITVEPSHETTWISLHVYCLVLKLFRLQPYTFIHTIPTITTSFHVMFLSSAVERVYTPVSHNLTTRDTFVWNIQTVGPHEVIFSPVWGVHVSKSRRWTGYGPPDAGESVKIRTTSTFLDTRILNSLELTEREILRCESTNWDFHAKSDLRDRKCELHLV